MISQPSITELAPQGCSYNPDKPNILFFPMTPVQNPRYSSAVIVNPTYIHVPPGCNVTAAGVELPVDWVRFTHPEGAVYFVNTTLHIVTDVQMQDAAVQAHMLEVIDQFQGWLTGLKISLPVYHEVYLLPDGIGSDKCKYYFVDHGARAQFWVESVESCGLGLPPAVSLEHLRCVFHEYYWTHMEFFPHQVVPVELRLDLLGVLRHARGDQMTSDYSTFPFDAEQCAKFINLLDISPAASENSYLTCVIGRIWALTFRHRFDHFYGQSCARLGRDQKRLEQSPEHRTCVMKAASWVLFNFPLVLKAEFDTLPTDNLLYVIHWRKFISSLRAQWQDSLKISIGLLMLVSDGLLC
ncbi:hypothetical protein NLI96_g2973 [Meripilus lineatus]|uniref:Uncharacterized protein n=1 Tax=Meripilus lineatus TaxID=2056292 RepID=A0AAD5V7S2_9APHY|nr:hypothetical protein NLI96_g2973 [Physisporinus lineatus]